MALTKATIVIDPRDVDGARGLESPITVQFNPTEYTLNKSAQIAEIAIPGIDSPILQFVRGQNEKLTLDLFFDTTAGGMGDNATDVRDQTNKIYQLVKIQSKTHALPRITFSWGQSLSFRAIVESVQQRFTLFNPRGVPLRATLAVTFREYKTLEEQISELNLQTADQTKTYVARRGDTLSRIAAEQYEDATQWRAIADANPGVDPLRPQPGTTLLLPPIAIGGASTGGSR
jgi:LysM repeat protein